MSGFFSSSVYIYIYTEGYSESAEPIDAVNILPLARFEPTTSTTPPSTTPDIDATNCATETSQKKDVPGALILTTPDAVHVVYWYIFNECIYIYIYMYIYICIYIYIYIYGCHPLKKNQYTKCTASVVVNISAS